MARVKLTTGRIRDFAAETGQSFLWDSEAPGMAVRATENGSKSFVFQAKLNGKPIRVTIGDVRAWGIDEARTEARRLQTLIDQGTDPREHKKERIAASEAKRVEAKRHDVTFGEAWAVYLADRKARWSERYLQNHLALAQEGGEPRTRGRRPDGPGLTQPGPIYPLLARRLSDLDSMAVKKWLEGQIERGPSQAEQAFRILRTFLNWCSEQPDYAAAVQRDACLTKAVRETVPIVKPKDDCLQREQLRPWFEAVRKMRNPVISAYLQGLLLTGARREELAGLKWQDVDFQWGSMTIHDKMEGERTIPLTPYLGSLLGNLPRRKDGKGKPLPWVFSSLTSANGRLQEPRIAHTKAIAAAGLPHITLHGLRRSFGTLAEWDECPTGVVAQIMGHKPSAIAEKHYRRRPLDLLRMWHTRIEAWILEQADIKQPDEVSGGLRLVKSNTAA